MKDTTTFIIVLILSVNFLNGQTKLKDKLVERIYSQSYLKLQDMEDCSMPMTTMEKRICANLEFQRVHKALDTLVKEIIADFKKEELLSIEENFLASQQEWIERRNKELIYISGEIDNIDLISKIHLETLTDLTLQRIAILEETMKD